MLLSLEQRRAIQRKDAADLRAFLLLIPLIACLFSIVLSIESSTFARTIVEMGDEYEE
jgi:hypothetical protein